MNIDENDTNAITTKHHAVLDRTVVRCCRLL